MDKLQNRNIVTVPPVSRQETLAAAAEKRQKKSHMLLGPNKRVESVCVKFVQTVRTRTTCQRSALND